MVSTTIVAVVSTIVLPLVITWLVAFVVTWLVASIVVGRNRWTTIANAAFYYIRTVGLDVVAQCITCCLTRGGGSANAAC